LDRTRSTLGAAKDRTMGKRRKVEISEPRMMPTLHIRSAQEFQEIN
jgi:hypothetical protein